MKKSLLFLVAAFIWSTNLFAQAPAVHLSFDGNLNNDGTATVTGAFYDLQKTDAQVKIDEPADAFAEGKKGQAVVYDNQTAYLRLNTGVNFHGSFTIMCWVYLNKSLTRSFHLFQLEDDSTNTGHTLMFISWAGDLRSFSGGAPTKNNVGINLRTWTHCTFVYDATAKTGTLYKDGVKSAESTDLGAETTTDKSVTIGNAKLTDTKSSGATNSFDGMMDGARIFEQALTQEQIQAVITGDETTTAVTKFNAKPNPFKVLSRNGSLTISLDGHKTNNAKVNIYDMTGRLIYAKLFNSNQMQVNQTFHPGIYIVSVNTNNKIYNKKIIF